MPPFSSSQGMWTIRFIHGNIRGGENHIHLFELSVGKDIEGEETGKKRILLSDDVAWSVARCDDDITST